jgi:hypothetical protein
VSTNSLDLKHSRLNNLIIPYFPYFLAFKHCFSILIYVFHIFSKRRISYFRRL